MIGALVALSARYFAYIEAGRSDLRNLMMWSNLGLCACLALIVSCGEGSNGSPHDASTGSLADGGSGPDSSLADGAPIEMADAGMPSPDAGPAPDAGPSGRRIDSVMTEDGHTQLRQGLGAAEDVYLILTGDGLDRSVDVSVGELGGQLLDVTANRVRARVFVPHGTTPGLRDVTLSAPNTSLTVPDAIEITPHVVGNDGPYPGRGTYQSPMRLCDDRLRWAEAGDTIELLAGRHRCSQQVRLEGGVTVVGDDVASTLLDLRGGAGGIVINSEEGETTAFRDLTVTATSAIDVRRHGRLVLERVTIESGSVSVGVSGSCRECDMDVYVRNASFVSSSLRYGGGTRVDIADSAFSSGSIVGSSGRLTAVRLSFFGGSEGVWLREVEDEDAPLGLVADTTFTNVSRAIWLSGGSLLMVNSRILQTPEQAGVSPAVLILDGQFAAQTVSMEGFRGATIDAFGQTPAAKPSVDLMDVRIQGGTHGVRLRGFSTGGLIMRESVIRAQTVAAISTEWNGAAGHDLTGSNELSVLSGIALDDLRLDPDNATIDAAGLVLNGRTHEGLVRGPIEQAPDFRISSGGEIDFGPPRVVPKMNGR